MHRVPDRLIELQVSSLGLPLVRLAVPRDAPNSVYEAQLTEALTPFRAQGVRHVAFGDLFLADIKAYRDALMARLGFEPVYPLWGEGTSVVADRFVRDGYRAVAVCVDAAKLDLSWAGREMDEAFFADLPPNVDPCGENGEFHSFVYDGPEFFYRVEFERSTPNSVGGFHYCNLRPHPGEACVRCGALFECGMKAGRSRCWCVTVAPVVPNDTWTSCLCPRCLGSQARR